MNKICTSIEQSRRLIELGVDINTANMYWSLTNQNHPPVIRKYCAEYGGMQLPAWSLTALLDVLPKIINHETLFVKALASLWHVEYRGIYTVRSFNLVDACYEMVVELHEQNLL